MATSDGPTVFQYVIQAGSFGLVTWLFYHIHTNIIPSYHKTIETLTTGFQTTVSKLSTDHQTSLSVINTAHQATVNKMVDTFALEMRTERAESRNERSVELVKMISSFEKLEDIIVSHDRDMRNYHTQDQEAMVRRILSKDGYLTNEPKKIT